MSAEAQKVQMLLRVDAVRHDGSLHCRSKFLSDFPETEDKFGHFLLPNKEKREVINCSEQCEEAIITNKQIQKSCEEKRPVKCFSSLQFSLSVFC